LTANRSTDVFPTFSRDGQWIYFSSTRTGTPLIWKMPAGGGEAVQVTRVPAMMALESMDGTMLYFVEGRGLDALGPLWQQPVNGGPAVKLLDNVQNVSFAVAATGIYYVERLPGDTRIVYFDPATRQSSVVASSLGAVTFGLTVSADGRRILFARVDSSVDDLMLVENFH
jgi:Tol biopolymer transport system component